MPGIDGVVVDREPFGVDVENDQPDILALARRRQRLRVTLASVEKMA
jgi:hypothetical protein